MTNPLPDFVPGTHLETGTPTAVTDRDTYESMAALIAAYPALLNTENTPALATIFLHFARPYAYTLITDPAAFEQSYLARIASEDPSQPWNEGPARLSDFGIPTFSDIKAPQSDGTTLHCWVRDNYSGLAYSATGPLADPSATTLQPMPLTAVARPEPVAITPIPLADAPPDPDLIDVTSDMGDAPDDDVFDDTNDDTPPDGMPPPP